MQLFRGLRDKMLAVMAAGLFLLFAMQYFLANEVVLKRFLEIERNSVSQATQRALDALGSNLQQLDSLASDWGGWDDAYRYARNPDRQFIRSNFTDSTLERLRLDGVLIARGDGRILFQTGRGFAGKTLPQALLDQAQPGGRLLQGTTQPVSGLLMTAEGPLLVAAHPITSSDGKAPPRGVMVMLRRVDARFVSELSRLTRLDVSLQPVAGSLSPDRQSALQRLQRPAGSIVTDAAPMLGMAGYTLLEDVEGKPLLLMRVLGDGDIAGQARLAVNILIWSALLIGLLLAGASLLFDRAVLRRLSHLSQGLQRIGDSGDTAARLGPISGNDELTHLAVGINGMLDKVVQAQSSLAQSEDRHRSLFSSRSIIKLLLDREGLVVEANPAALAMLGKPADEIEGRPLWDFVLLEDAPRLMQTLTEAAVDGEAVHTVRLAVASGQLRDMELHFSPMQIDGRELHYVIAFDITERRQFEEALRQEKECAQTTLASIADAVITIDEVQRINFMNGAAERLTGVDFSDAYGSPLDSLVRLFNQDTRAPIDVRWLLEMDSNQSEVLLERADGEEFVVQKSVAPLHDRNDGLFGSVIVLHDVTALRTLSLQLNYQASHDALTGLVNRYEFDRLLQHAILDAAATHRTHAVAYLDLDKFKVVNDSCGHMAGDALLRQLAAAMQSKVRGADTFARLGGDEFGLLLTGCTLESAQAIAQSLLQAVSDFRFSHDDKIFKVGVSIGLVAVDAQRGQTISEVLSAVDTACYVAKEGGGNRIHVLRQDDAEVNLHHTQLEWVSRIHEGIEKNLFRVYWQPMRALGDQGVPHCELLIRMHGEDGKVYSPGFFLPAAERYHLMPRLDRWMIDASFASIARKGPDFPYVCAINLSGQTLSEEDIFEFVTGRLQHYHIDPRRICFEITETSVISNLTKAKHFIHSLHERGCQFSLDDFGSGLSSFGYLKHLQVDFLKVDGMFVKNIVHSPIDRAMVEAINHVGHVMQLQTIAEYAEDDAIIAVLAGMGIDYAQGYGVAKPELFE